MQSDTIIGIVGAVVLVSVMVGVFAYEYNNVDTDEPTEAEQQAQREADFAAMYDSLDPNGDLDGDGVSNVNETDLDGDGINNTEDDAFQFSRVLDASGAIAAGPPATGYSLSFDAEDGVGHVMLELRHDAILEQAGQQQPSLSVTLTDPTGLSLPVTITYGAQTVYSIDHSLDVAPGTYTLSVQPFSVGGALAVFPDTQVSGELEFHYFA
ncbi:MAG: hypothetical protein ACPHID_06960 [Thermoplasmatota archaeon]